MRDGRHLSLREAGQPFVAACGADEANQETTAIPEHVGCPACRRFLSSIMAPELARLRHLNDLIEDSNDEEERAELESEAAAIIEARSSSQLCILDKKLTDAVARAEAALRSTE